MGRTKRLVAGLVAVAVVAVGLASCVTPVTPSVTWSRSTFEGFPVISYVPEHPVGMIYLFHGTNGSAEFATKVETVDTLNRFVADGYGFVSTESTERTGDQRWDPSNPSLTTNPDLARLLRLQANLVATTGLEPTTPLYGIGMSNGARFVTLWGQTWKDAGYPVRAIWAAHGRVADPVTSAGGLTVPTFFTSAANDFTVPPIQVVTGYVQMLNRGTPAEYHQASERPLVATQYLRLPGIDGTTANGIVAALKATGVWDAGGTRVVADIQQAVTRAATAVLPAKVAQLGLGAEVGNETAVLLAVHQFSVEFAPQAGAFFAAYRAG